MQQVTALARRDESGMRICHCKVTSHPDTSVYVRLAAGVKMYCGDWEKGANRIVAHQRKWLLQRNYNICKIQAHRPFHASSIGVVTCVGEQRYVPFSQSPQYISDLQHGGGQTDVYGSDQNVTSHAMGVCWIVTVGGAPEAYMISWWETGLGEFARNWLHCSWQLKDVVAILCLLWSCTQQGSTPRCTMTPAAYHVSGAPPTRRGMTKNKMASCNVEIFYASKAS